MKAIGLRLLALCPLFVFGACADKGAPTGPEVAIGVAPLTLPDVSDVEYAVAVFNDDPLSGYAADEIFDEDGSVLDHEEMLVWQQSSLWSDQYGNGAGGDISYVGPCDADIGNDNYVALDLKTVETDDGTLDDQNTAPDGDGDPDFVNPSPYNDPLILHFECLENQDVSVVFNLTIMRDAEQGFFDVAVNFDDIFCSMKFDSCDVNDDDIELLFGDEDGEDGVVDGDGRDHTAVFAMACTAGPGEDIDTEILIGQVQVVRPDVTFQLPLTDLDQGTNYVKVDLDGDEDSSHAVQYGLYWGDEQLDCGTAEEPVSCNKAYFNIALDLEDLPAGCTLSLEATAQDANDPVIDESGVIGSEGTTYPFVQLANAELDGCFSWQPGDADGEGDGPLQVHYGASKDVVNGGIAAVMCDRSNDANPPKALPETSKWASAGGDSAEKIDDARLVPFVSLGKLGRLGASYVDPCSGRVLQPRILTKGDYQRSEILVPLRSENVKLLEMIKVPDALKDIALMKGNIIYEMGMHGSNLSEVVFQTDYAGLEQLVDHGDVISAKGIAEGGELIWGARLNLKDDDAKKWAEVSNERGIALGVGRIELDILVP